MRCKGQLAMTAQTLKSARYLQDERQRRDEDACRFRQSVQGSDAVEPQRIEFSRWNQPVEQHTTGFDSERQNKDKRSKYHGTLCSAVSPCRASGLGWFSNHFVHSPRPPQNNKTLSAHTQSTTQKNHRDCTECRGHKKSLQ